MMIVKTTLGGKSTLVGSHINKEWLEIFSPLNQNTRIEAIIKLEKKEVKGQKAAEDNL